MQSRPSQYLNVIVSTRFGVGVTDQAWLEHRFLLFEAITAPSLHNQTCTDFVWNIFVGEQAEEWVVDRLKLATEGVGKQVIIHRKAQNHKDLQQCSESHPMGASHTLLLLIDDDDAWSVNYVESCVKKGLDYVRNGQDKVAFTFSNGLEWLITDLIDVDAYIGKNKKIIRQSSAYYYRRPFLTMGTALLSPQDDLPEKFPRVHSTMGECLLESGYSLSEVILPDLSWLYVRHRQADSSIRKAHNVAPLELPLGKLEDQFGVSAKKIVDYQMRSAEFGYAKKRVIKHLDKSDLCLSINEGDGFLKEKTDNISGLIRVMAFARGFQLVFQDIGFFEDCKVRVISYKISTAEYLLKKVFPEGFDGFIYYKDIDFSSDLKFKVQLFDGNYGRWFDASPYVKVSNNEP